MMCLDLKLFYCQDHNSFTVFFICPFSQIFVFYFQVDFLLYCPLIVALCCAFSFWIHCQNHCKVTVWSFGHEKQNMLFRRNRWSVSDPSRKRPNDERTCCDFTHRRPPSCMSVLCGHCAYFCFLLRYMFESWIFLFCLFFLCCCFLVTPPPLPPQHHHHHLSMFVQAAKLQWSLDEKVGSSRDTRVSRLFVYLCVHSMFIK